MIYAGPENFCDKIVFQTFNKCCLEFGALSYSKTVKTKNQKHTPSKHLSVPDSIQKYDNLVFHCLL